MVYYIIPENERERGCGMSVGNGNDERDAFWDIGKLVPRRRAAAPRFSSTDPVVPIVDGRGEPPRGDAAERRLTPPPSSAASVEHTYTPEGNPLLLSVTVRRTPGGYSFYEQFRREALREFDTEGAPVPYIPFFSFTPQYNQLSAEQRAYYFYLRSEVRAGRYPRADKGYFFLLVYEIINLPERIPPVEGARMLADLWGGYRREISGLDRYMIPWLTDYCLVHAVPCPPLTSDCLSAAAEGEEVEFFFGNAAERTEEGLLRFLQLCSDYHFEASRILTDENRAAVTRHITGALAAVLPHLLEAGLIRRSEKPERLVRRAFAGSLCAHNVRAEITLSYVSLRRAEGLRKTVGLAVKHAENRLRAALGIRARLSASALPPRFAEVIDAYFASAAVGLSGRREAPPAYERLYAAPEEGLDRDSAAAIEEASWELTRRLVADVEEETPPPTETAPAPSAPAAASAEEGALALVSAFLEGGGAPALAARRAGIPLALAAERVNDLFLDLLGDVLLAPEGDRFVLIEDYREEAEAWLKTNRK